MKNPHFLLEKFGSIRTTLMRKLSWFQTGGPVQIFKPHNEETLYAFLNETSDPITMIGAASNILVRDGGIPGYVIRLGSHFNQIAVHDNLIIAGAACLDKNIAEFAADAGLSGLEFLIGIPGTIGGAVAMNAGAYGSELAEYLEWVEIVTSQGIQKVFRKNLHMEYRKTTLPKEAIVTRVALDAAPKDPLKIRERMNKFLIQRETTQPIKSRTGGSTFKNPTGYKAWELIDQAKCRGLSINDAQVSPKHCNFLINHGNASAKDLEELGETVRKRVFDTSGVMLEWEIKRLGIQ